jgi:hypothetical protein
MATARTAEQERLLGEAEGTLALPIDGARDPRGPFIRRLPVNTTAQQWAFTWRTVAAGLAAAALAIHIRNTINPDYNSDNANYYITAAFAGLAFANWKHHKLLAKVFSTAAVASFAAGLLFFGLKQGHNLLWLQFCQATGTAMFALMARQITGPDTSKPFPPKYVFPTGAVLAGSAAVLTAVAARRAEAGNDDQTNKTLANVGLATMLGGFTSIVLSLNSFMQPKANWDARPPLALAGISIILAFGLAITNAKSPLSLNDANSIPITIAAATAEMALGEALFAFGLFSGHSLIPGACQHHAKPATVAQPEQVRLLENDSLADAAGTGMPPRAADHLAINASLGLGTGTTVTGHGESVVAPPADMLGQKPGVVASVTGAPSTTPRGGAPSSPAEKLTAEQTNSL